MFKKFLKKHYQLEPITPFPLKKGNAQVNELSTSYKEDLYSRLEHDITQKILTTLLDKYDFEPVDKYREEIENKKKYIHQLDQYLCERKELNRAVDNELQGFLYETTQSITNALNAFSDGVSNRLLATESKYGIDKIKHILNQGNSNEL